MYCSADKYRQRVRKRDNGVLIPPPRHYYGHIEAKHEGDRYEVTIVFTVLDNIFKDPEKYNLRKSDIYKLFILPLICVVKYETVQCV